MIGVEQGNFESLDLIVGNGIFRVFTIMICESMVSAIIEIRTVDMVFKFKLFFDLSLSLG